jgi:cellulose synthase/poly-beta-1,6-N-acetylglucosamine synthase-like glycosyltransferase
MQYLLAACVALLLYVYFGYPIVLRVLGARRAALRTGQDLPSVTLYIPAFNEARVIGEKVKNALSLEYPQDLLQIVVVSDGSTDGTVEIAQKVGGSRVRVWQSPGRMGKSALINRYLPRCSGEVIVFTDANAMYTPDSLLNLARHFADPKVGLVAGNLKYVDQFTAVAKGEGLYFRYESLLKRLESRLGSVVAATGSIYAVRRRLVRDFAPDVANDLAHPIQVAADGFKLVFEPQAVALERATASADEEFRRKARIVTRGMTAFSRYRREYKMLRGLWGFCFISHKLLRWFGWAYALGIFVASAALVTEGVFYQVLLGGQIVFYGLALAGWAAGHKRHKALAVPFYFTMINLAALSGALRFVSGTRQAIWDSAATTR